MGLIQIPPSPAAMTTEQKQSKAKAQIVNATNQLYRQMVMVFSGVMNTVWNNADGLTPQQVFDGVGTDSGSLAVYGAQLAALINLAIPGGVNGTPPLPLTTNPDGTITVGSAPSGS